MSGNKSSIPQALRTLRAAAPEAIGEGKMLPLMAPPPATPALLAPEPFTR
jgi:hypothetical protein